MSAEACSDLEHLVAGIQIGLFDHQGHDEGLRNGLAIADRKRRVFIGEFFEARIDGALRMTFSWDGPTLELRNNCRHDDVYNQP